MVQVRKTQLVGRDGSFDSVGWAASLQLRDGSEARLERAAEAAIAAAAEGDFGAFHTGLEMVQILHELRLEGDALVAALLYRSVRQGLLELDAVRAEFGEEVARLIDGVLRMAVISRMIQPVDGSVLGQHQSQSDNVRRMLVSLIDDVRIALLKLAERCCAIRSVKNRPDKQIRVAREVSHIYAPLAQRLGVGHIKWELEDLAFRYLQPEDYRYVAQLLDERRLDRQEYIALVIAQLGGALQAQQLDADIFGRPKHIYSIWRKMQHKRIGFSEVFDVRALRVLVDRVADCYAVLGVVHTLWPNISSEFDDYIANPKVNGYQSLHTAVYGPQGKVLEVQIRTRQMHEAAEPTGSTRGWTRHPARWTATTRRSPGCARCWCGTTSWASGRICAVPSAKASPRIASMCSRRTATWSICRRARRRWISPITSTPRWVTAAGAPRSTAASCR
jgi:GTP pyrophosphokinase